MTGGSRPGSVEGGRRPSRGDAKRSRGVPGDAGQVVELESGTQERLKTLLSGLEERVSSPDWVAPLAQVTRLQRFALSTDDEETPGQP